MTGSPGSLLFRLSPVGTALNLLVPLFLILPGAGILLARPDDTMGVLVGAYLLGSGLYLAARVFVWRVRVDDTHLRVVGMLWSRTIPRAQVLAVSPDISAPSVEWRTKAGAILSTPLTIVTTSNLPFLPRAARQRRIDFMNVLEFWADGASLSEAEKAVVARAQSRIDPPVRGTRRDRRLRPDASLRRADPFVEVGDWVVPILAVVVVVGALGIGKRGPALPLEVSAWVVAVAGGLMAAVTLSVVVRRAMKSVPDKVRRAPFGGAALAGIAAAGILLYRAEQQVAPNPEIVWGVAGALCATAAAAVLLFAVRPRG